MRWPAPPENASEHLHQVYFVAWFRRTFPNETIFAIPNGGHRGKAQAARLKAEGVLSGVPDLFALERRAWIEMKTPKGRPSKAQTAFLKKAKSAGYVTILGYGAVDAAKKLMEMTKNS